MSDLSRIKIKYLKKINSLENYFKELSDEDLKNKTIEFKERYNNGESLESLLPEAFANIREVIYRVINIRLYDVQLIGAIVLFEGKVAEMRTGEGKTFTSVPACYLNTIANKSVHIITVNDYLASRDASLVKPIYDFLGITNACIDHETSSVDRKNIYTMDIVYITNSELGFDYLRDNMAKDINQKVQSRTFDFCIIDEVDSVLIDEARTPLIISSPNGNSTDLYSICDIFIKNINKEDYEVDKQIKVVMFTDSGIKKVEKFFRLINYSNIENTLLRHHLEQALKANYEMKKDKEYIIRNNEIVLVDEHTGRLADGRRFSQGLHQALEAKEGVKIKEESITLASITYQNFFKQYTKVSGMTGTAKTEEKEFKETYDLKIVEIPTNKPCIRKDLNDLIFITEEAKNKAIIEDIKNCYKIGRPVLVGTLDIKKSEILSQLLKKENIPHNILNAKQNEQEARIIEKAGQKGIITIATNMAGRGTDIKLTDEVKDLGGLKIIASERAVNRRIDNQLKGRSGRQGAPGESQFYLSFQDELITYVANSKLKKIEKLDKQDDTPINNKIFDNIINGCQKKIENQHFETRKQTTKYDKILNNQRIEIYNQRDYVLKNNCTDIVKNMIDFVFNKEFVDINDNILQIFPKEFYLTQKNIDKINKYDTIRVEVLIETGLEILDNFEKLGGNINDIILNVVDNYWIKHLVEMTELKQDIKLISYRGEDPINLYTKEAYNLFNKMNYDIKVDIIKSIFKFVKNNS